jgi:hypothetical protein
MTNLKYGKYILKGKSGKTSGPGFAPEALVTFEGPEDWAGIQPRLGWRYITRPTFLKDSPHTHDFDEFLIFLGPDPAEPKNFGAEIEISLGPERETHIINSNTVVCIPEGLVHCPLKFNKIDKPVVFAVACLAPEYVSRPVTNDDLSPVNTKGSKYGKYILRETKREGARKNDNQEWGVHIDEKTTSGIGKFNCNFTFLGVLKPHVLMDPPHQHNCDEFLFLVPSSGENWPDLGGEVEIAMGDDWEKQSINTAAVVCLPPGIQHCPVYMKTVDTPFYWGHFLMASSYDSSAYVPE